MTRTPALALSALAALVVTAAGSSAPKPKRLACGVLGNAVARLATAVPVVAQAAGGGRPVVVDLAGVPGIVPGAPLKGAPPSLPQPGYERARKLKSADPACAPSSPPTLPGLPAAQP